MTVTLDDEGDDEYVCGHCRRGNDCHRCVERACVCCSGAPDDDEP